MVRRIRGLLIVLRVLSPILLAGALALATWWMADTVVDATRDYGDDLGGRLDEIGRALDEADEGLQAMAGFVLATVDAADDLVTTLTELPIVSLPLSLPGMGPVEALAEQIVAAGETITEPLTKVAAIAEIPPQLEQVAEDTADYAATMRSTMSSWVKWVLLLLAAAALLWLAAQARPITSELRRGLAMMLGRPPPKASAVSALERRVADLRREIARLH